MTLALLGGDPIRNSEFRSQPMVGREEIDLISDLMSRGQFSKFVGSPTADTRDLLAMKSRECPLNDVGFTFLGGEYVRKLEAEWSQITGADYCISVNSATSGLTAALLALGLEPGSEVITTPFSFSASVAAIVAAHCVPVFCDIDPETFCLCPNALEELITENTRCVMPVHWCGNVGDLDRICAIAADRGVYVLEDASQAPASVYQGKAVGCWGDIGVFSFNEPKNIMTGEGGLILTSQRLLAEKCRLIRNHGEAIVDDDDSDEYINNVVGYNFRLTELHAAIAYVQTRKRDQINGIRAKNYHYLTESLARDFDDLLVAQRITHPDSFYAYTAAFKWLYRETSIARDIVAEALLAEGIPVFKKYHRLLCDHPMFKRRIAFGLDHFPWGDSLIDYGDVEVPNARELVDRQYLGFFQLGWPNTTEDMDDIIAAFAKIREHLDELVNCTVEPDGSVNIGR